MKRKKEWIFPPACLCCALWGSAFPGVKIGYQLFQIESSDTAAILLFAGTRFFLAGVLTILAGSLLAAMEKRREDSFATEPGKAEQGRSEAEKAMTGGKNGFRLLTPQKGSWKYIFCLSLFQTVLQYLFFYVGLAHTSGVKSSIVQSVNVFVAIAISVWVFRLEKMTRKKVAGCIVGIAGVILVNLEAGALDFHLTLTGEGFIFFSTVAHAFSVSLIKIFSRKESPVVLSGYQFAVGGLIMMGVGLLCGGRFGAVSLPGCAMLIYLAMVSAVAYTLWGILLKKYELSKVTVYGFLTPVFGALLSAIFLGEGELLQAKNIGALLLVCLGIWIVNTGRLQKQEFVENLEENGRKEQIYGSDRMHQNQKERPQI
ncbi:MAG: DMT family transporter [Lachnospiraceae bacterium]|nr:DMT family transporter [Lachnospiraceae bacterium]